MKYLTKLIYNIRSNILTKVYVEPINKEIDPINTADAMMSSFVKSGNVENYYYDTAQIIYDDLSDNNTKYLWYNKKYPPGQVSALLKDDVKLGDNPLELIEEVILGEVPKITSALYTKATAKVFAEQLGVVYKDITYDDKLIEINRYLDESLDEYLSTAPQLLSVQRNKNLMDYTLYTYGNVLCKIKPYHNIETSNFKNATDEEILTDPETTSSKIEISGYQFKTGGYDVDYYNDIIIPTSTKTITQNIHKGVVRQDIYDRNFALGQNIKEVDIKLFPNEIESQETREYKYKGANPLIIESSRLTTLRGEIYISRDRFKVFAVMKGLQIVDALIVNGSYSQGTDIYGEGGAPYVEMQEIMRPHYKKVNIDGVDFYRQIYSEKSRIEDILTAYVKYNDDVASKEVIYQCNRGLGSWGSLAQMLSMINENISSTIFKNGRTLSLSEYKNYETKIGREAKTLDHYMLGQQGGALVDITDQLNIEFKTVPMELSTVQHIPQGKNLSVNHLSSHRIGELTTDFDSKSYQGGGINYQTFVWPTYQCKKTVGDGNIPKNINVGSANLYSEKDLLTIADNFNEQLNISGNVAVSYKGIVKHNELVEIFGEKGYIIDKIVYDIGKNATMFECRAELTS